jgi:MFS family permease
MWSNAPVGEARLDSARGWSVAVAGGLASGVSFGTVYTFGAFFDAMADDLGSGRGATALVFGVTLLLFFGTGVVSGPLSDRFGPRPLVFSGAALLAAGLALTSEVDGVLGGYLTYGVGVGVGGGLIITPMYVAAGGWFVRRRALAMGVVATGNGLGTLLLVPFAERLIADHGWRTAYLVLAVLDLVLLCAAGLVVARAPIPTAPPALAHMRAVAVLPAFRRLFLTGLLFSVSLFIAFGFVVDFATEDGVSSSRAALLVGIIGAASVVGRLGLTALSGRWPAVRLLQGCLAVQPVAFMVWLSAGDSYPLLVAFALLLGTAYGGFVALGPEAVAVLFGVVGLGGAMGLLFLGSGLGGLVGPPLAGWLADSSDGTTLPIALAIGVAAVAFALSLAIPTSGQAPPATAAAAGQVAKAR